MANKKENNPDKNNPDKNNPVKNNPVKNNPVKNNPVKNNPVKNNPVKNNPVKNNPVKNNPVNNNIETKSIFNSKYSSKITDEDIMNQFKNSKPVFGNQSDKNKKTVDLNENDEPEKDKNATNDENKNENKIKLCFEKEAKIFKFKDSWIACGTGTVYITEDKSRIFFIRHGIPLKSFDFLMNFDMKPERKNKDVIFNGVSVDDNSEPVLMSFALRFNEEKIAIIFEDILKSNTK
ncbi:hypothetical protein DMUE_1570 [Dictyocoela muelleri]|nr:hypothetical protein DMUE_1570 [Dictyocoela muelleri]